MRLSAVAGAQATWQRQTQQAALLLPPPAPSPASPRLCSLHRATSLPLHLACILPRGGCSCSACHHTEYLFHQLKAPLMGQSRACRRGASEAGSGKLWGLFPVCSLLAPSRGANAGLARLGAEKEGHGRHLEPHTCRAGTACHHLEPPAAVSAGSLCFAGLQLRGHPPIACS